MKTKTIFLTLALLVAFQAEAVVKKTIPKKNIYTDPTAGFSIEIPKNWQAQSEQGFPDADGRVGISIVDPTGVIALDNVAFSITATPRPLQDASYLKTYNVKPTNKDLWDMFMSSQEGLLPYWEVLDKNISKVTINGLTGYRVNVAYGPDRYARAVYYMLFDKNYIYVLSIHSPNKTFLKTSAQYKKYILTFKAKR